MPCQSLPSASIASRAVRIGSPARATVFLYLGKSEPGFPDRDNADNRVADEGAPIHVHTLRSETTPATDHVGQHRNQDEDAEHGPEPIGGYAHEDECRADGRELSR